MTNADACADDIVCAIFDRIPALAALSGWARAVAEEDARRLIADTIDSWFILEEPDWPDTVNPRAPA